MADTKRKMLGKILMLKVAGLSGNRILVHVLRFVGIVGCVYTVLGFVLLPFGLRWAVESQGSKLLKRKLTVSAVWINPYMFSMGVRGVELRDFNGEPLFHLRAASLDVSFLSLLKKVLRVESVVFEGLEVDARLSAGGRLNLLDLVASLPVQKSSAAGDSAQALSPRKVSFPPVFVDSLLVREARLGFTDETVSPRFVTNLGGLLVRVTGFSTDAGAWTSVLVEGSLDGQGSVNLEARLKPLQSPLDLEMSCVLGSYVLRVLSPYVGKYTGRELDDGKFDLRMDYRISGNRLSADHRLLVQNFTFGRRTQSKDALGLPFGLALALLEDANGQIKVALPVTGDLSDPQFRFWPLVGQVVRNFFFKVVSSPFAFLGSVLGAESGTDELGYVRFQPGQAVLMDAEREKLATLVRGMAQRPALKLEVKGAFDPDMDWKALAEQALAKDYARLREGSSRTESQLYQMLYQRSFGIRGLWSLAKKYKNRTGQYQEDAFIAEIRRQLIESAPANNVAMQELAAERARVVHSALLSLGLNEDKVGFGVANSTHGSMGSVAMELTLTVTNDGEP